MAAGFGQHGIPRVQEPNLIGLYSWPWLWQFIASSIAGLAENDDSIPPGLRLVTCGQSA